MRSAFFCSGSSWKAHNLCLSVKEKPWEGKIQFALKYLPLVKTSELLKLVYNLKTILVPLLVMFNISKNKYRCFINLITVTNKDIKWKANGAAPCTFVQWPRLMGGKLPAFLQMCCSQQEVLVSKSHDSVSNSGWTISVALISQP